VEHEQAYHWLAAWFCARYSDLAEVCPYESAEGGYQYLWGGPYDAHEVLAATWGDVFTTPVLAAVAARLERDHRCTAWSRAPATEGARMKCSIPPLLCTHCGACDVPTIGPGTGPHVARALCRACGAFIKWLPRGLIEASAPTAVPGDAQPGQEDRR